ncbi:MAG: 50S ribosomal protein L9 [Candidatus Pelagibacter sp.]|nr:50S ribosomal protein L9 [Candidatus Pelagibacter sp.]RPG11021.1 MAG: 50S ribosomal protein L9 [Pelagibacteraceae bacterium TMED170]|tara:strand:+ start:1499 stop:1954 length:456 start_codon:yes stop_codon:yes gene_type:complete
MQVILLENVMKLGKIGDLVEVKNGYGRNFLLKTGKALRADKENIALVNKKKDELNKKNEEAKKTFKEIAAKINKKTLTFSKEAKDNGELFGSIKPKEVSNSFLTNLKVEINPSQIDLKQEINKIGTYKIDINLFSEVSASISVIVKKAESN